MAEQQSHKKNKPLKVFLIGLILFVSIQLLARYMLTTSWVHNLVKVKIESLANEQLNATFKIGGLDGNLWEEIQLTEVSISKEEPFFSADTLYVNYNIWSFLRDIYVINSIQAIGIEAYISEDQDSIFNIQQVVKRDIAANEGKEESDLLKLVLNKIELREINATIVSSSYLPDSVLKVSELSATASFQKTDELRTTLNSLSFLIEEGRLPKAIKVKTSGKLFEEQITLEEMVVETGLSIVKAKATTTLSDSTVSANISTSPFSLVDIQPYLDIEIPRDKLNLELSVSGSFDDLKIKINLDHQYAQNIEMLAGIKLKRELTLTRFDISGNRLNIAHFTNDSLDVDFDNFSASISGNLSEDISAADVNWDFMFNNFRFERYYIEKIIADGLLKEDNFTAQIKVNPHLKERINSDATIHNVSSNSPEWRVNFDAYEFNISSWADTEEISSNINFSGFIDGRGFSLTKEPWKYLIQSNLNKQKSTQFAGQYFNAFELKGELTENMLEAEGHLAFDESRIDFEFDAEDILDKVPKYNYFITSENFDLSEINQTTDLPTALNLDLHGEGRGFDIEDNQIFATVDIDSSIINGSEFEQMEASIKLDGGIFTISEGILRSDIIEGNFSGRKNIADQTDPENWLTLDMLVKNIQPLAPLVNVELLNAKGRIKGRITQDTSKILRGNMELDFEDIIIDTLFTASRISGKTDVMMSELRQFNLNLSIEAPIISGVTFQDIELVSNGVANVDTLQSTFDLDIIGSERGKLVQSGLLNISFKDELVDIRFDRFNFQTIDSELAIQQPFNVRIDKRAISTDTLDLQSNSGAYLGLSIPYADSVEQYGWFTGENFDFGIIQEVVFGKRFLDGVLSGQMFFNRSPEDITSSGAFNLTGITYEGTSADSLDLTFDVREERLFSEISVSWDEEEKIIGDLNVPFVLKDASELEDDFFNQPVDGSLVINPSEITRFKAFLNEFDITETDGVLSFNGSMSGTAGQPNFEGGFVVNDPILSGIKVDTVSANFRYDDTKGGLQIQSQVIAAKQKAAEIEINYPVQYDFQSFNVIFPDDDDLVKANVKTENFNIAVFNDFLNKDYMNDLKGILNANLSLEGTSDNMEPKGFLRLSGAAVAVPIAGITLDGVYSDIEFTPNGLNVKEITAKSGRGSFSADGLIVLEGIIPQTINLAARANQFRIANTDDYNLVIDLNGRLSGKAQTPKATGKLTVRNGFIFLKDFGENTVEEVQLEGEEISSFSPYDSLSMEMVFEIQRDFYVRNRGYLDMEIEMIGELDAVKETKGDLSLFGSLNGVEGYVRPLGKLFKMEEANFTFSGPIDDYDQYIKSKYTPPTRQKGETVEVFYIIDNSTQPPFRFDSNPSMEQSDIICFTLFGKPCYSLESWQSIFTSGGGSPTATDVLTDVLLDEVEALATRELGVDVVQIDNSGASGGTSIKTGWYINQRTFFAIINELTGSTPKTLFMLEYILSENWDLIVTQGGDTRRGVDFRFQFDY